MGKQRGRANKMRDRNMLQAVAFGMITLPTYDWSESKEIARQRLDIKKACMRAARELGWELRRSPSTSKWEVWRPGMDLPWWDHSPKIWDNEPLRLQSCCRLIVKKSLLNEEGT